MIPANELLISTEFVKYFNLNSLHAYVRLCTHGCSERGVQKNTSDPWCLSYDSCETPGMGA